MDETDDTLSLSFVDCISCGLAAGLFLLILFAVLPRATSPQPLGSTSAANKVQFVFDDTAGSSFADVEIHVLNRTFDPQLAAWRDASDGRLVYESKAGAITYFRAFSSGLSGAPLDFTVPHGLEPPRGFIYLHAGGRSVMTRFDCTGRAESPNGWVLLNRFDMRKRNALGDCVP